MQDETSFPCSEYPPTGLYAKRNQYTAILRTIPLRWIILPLRFVFWRELFPLWPHSQILAASFHFLRTLYKLRPFYPPWSIHPSMSPRTKHQCRTVSLCSLISRGDCSLFVLAICCRHSVPDSELSWVFSVSTDKYWDTQFLSLSLISIALTFH
jgi:hypothetical protein